MILLLHGNDISLNKNLLSTYTQIAKSNTVLEQVITDLNLDMTPNDLFPLVHIESVNNTQVFKISVANSNPELAAYITNHLLEVFTKEIHRLYNVNNIYVMDQAEASYTPYNVHPVKDFVSFFMVGLVCSFVFVVIFYLLDTTIKSEKDIEDYTDLSVLSIIPVYTPKSGKESKELIVNEEPNSPISECFKTFRTNMMFSIQNKNLHTILVTSGFMGEGKSFASSNLAVAFANSGKKVILVDTDMRKGRIHKIFDLPNEQGLSTCLSKIATHKVDVNEFIKESAISNLHVMTAGIVPPNPSELLSSSHMVRLLRTLNKQYDVVICDGTPCMLVSDSIILSKIVDSTVIVTASKVTKLDTLLKMKKSIEMVGGHISGAIINMMEVSGKSYQHSYYYGNHENLTISSTSFVHDSILDTPLFIEDFDRTIDNEFSECQEEGLRIGTSTEFIPFSNMIKDNTKQVSELKILYKDVMRNIATLLDQNTSSSEETANFSNLILKKLEDLQKDYSDSLQAQTNEMNELNQKIENIQASSREDSILEKLEDLQKDYSDSNLETEEELKVLKDTIKNYDPLLFQTQETKIENLMKEVTNLQKQETANKLLNEVVHIAEQLEIMNHRFDALETKANYNETLINDLSMEFKNTLSTPSSHLDISKLGHKVIQIQDYLENSSQIVEEAVNLKSNKKDTNVLSGQMSFLNNDLAENVTQKEVKTIQKIEAPVREKKLVIDYETEKQKHEHKGFSLFKSKPKKVIEEEPVSIVSQILLKNTESVG